MLVKGATGSRTPIKEHRTKIGTAVEINFPMPHMFCDVPHDKIGNSFPQHIVNIYADIWINLRKLEIGCTRLEIKTSKLKKIATVSNLFQIA